MTVLLILNALIATATVVAALLALQRPSRFSGSRHIVAGEVFFARMYASRAIPFGILAAVLPFLTSDDAVPARLVLIAAALIQADDVLIGLKKKEMGMVGGAAAAVVIHLLTAVFV